MTQPFHYSAYRYTDKKLINEFIKIFPMATIVSNHSNEFLVSHIPLFRDEKTNYLWGHVDANNPQFSVSQIANAQIIFHGINQYIPPEAYLSKQLPTWNYLTVHMQGGISINQNTEQNLTILETTSSLLQPKEATFQFSKQDPRIQKNVPFIKSICFKPTFEEGRFKLSQDKSFADQQAVLEKLLNIPTQQIKKFILDILSSTHND